MDGEHANPREPQLVTWYGPPKLSERTLTPAQLKRELQRIAWGQVRLAQKLGVWPSEVRDWLAGKEPVPEVVASDIRHLPSHNLRPRRHS